MGFPCQPGVVLLQCGDYLRNGLRRIILQQDVNMIPVCFHSPDVPVISFAGIKDILFYIIPDPPGEQLFRYFVAKIRCTIRRFLLCLRC